MNRVKLFFAVLGAVVLFSVGAWAQSGRGTFTDSRDGKTYRTVRIGNQTWMAENLNYQTGNSWCYDDNESNCNTYGRLYDWNTAMVACPVGWHLPTNNEWDELLTSVGATSMAGTKLKSTSGWRENGNGTDEYGFNALPGGDRNLGDDDNLYSNVGYFGQWWSATEYNARNAGSRGMSFNYIHDYVSSTIRGKSYGFSVRCVRRN